MAILTLIWGKVWEWVCGIGAFLAILGAAWLLGRSKGKQSQQADTQAAENAAATAQVVVKQLESRHETDAQVQRLPDAPAQRIADADPATAAGRLQDWTRD